MWRAFLFACTVLVAGTIGYLAASPPVEAKIPAAAIRAGYHYKTLSQFRAPNGALYAVVAPTEAAPNFYAEPFLVPLVGTTIENENGDWLASLPESFTVVAEYWQGGPIYSAKGSPFAITLR